MFSDRQNRMDGWMDGWMAGWMDGWMGGSVGGWVVESADGWMDGHENIYKFTDKTIIWND